MLKCTAFFTLGNAGWSETWFRDGTALVAARNSLQTLVSLRMRLCHSSVTCIGLRVSDTDNPVIFTVLPVNIVGSATGNRDITNAALFWNAVGVNFSRRQIVTRGQPDQQILNGLYQGVPPFDTDANAWANQILSDAWCIRVQSRTPNPIVDGAGVDAAGVLTTFASQTWLVGQTLKFFRTKDTLGRAVSGTWKIVASTDDTHFTLRGWTAGRVVAKPRVRRYVLVPEQVAQITINRASSRKTGRPFGSPRGRALVRR